MERQLLQRFGRHQSCRSRNLASRSVALQQVGSYSHRKNVESGFDCSCSPGEPVLRKYGRIHVIVYDSGEVLYVPHVRIKALCQFKLSRWPFDVQKCYLRFTPWSFRWNEIQLNLYNDESFVDVSVLKCVNIFCSA